MSIRDMINSIADGHKAEAGKIFQDEMLEKIRDAVDVQRVSVAANFLQPAVEEEVVEEEVEAMSDEEWNSLTEEEQQEYVGEGALGNAVRKYASAMRDSDEGDRPDMKKAKKDLHKAVKNSGIQAKRGGNQNRRAAQVAVRLLNKGYGSDSGHKVQRDGKGVI